MGFQPTNILSTGSHTNRALAQIQMEHPGPSFKKSGETAIVPSILSWEIKAVVLGYFMGYMTKSQWPKSFETEWKWGFKFQSPSSGPCSWGNTWPYIGNDGTAIFGQAFCNIWLGFKNLSHSCDCCWCKVQSAIHHFPSWLLVQPPSRVCKSTPMQQPRMPWGVEDFLASWDADC